MAQERTLSIIKPDGVERNLIGEILARFERAGLRIMALKKTQLETRQAEAFYAIHREKPFFPRLVEYMTSGPIVVSALEGERAIDHHRELLGATNPEKAAQGTIRKDFGQSITINTVHGSDAPETAAAEIAFFFSSLELLG